MAIVKMKRVTFVTLAAEGEALLRRLQDLGVLHPEPIRPIGESEVVSHLEHELHVQHQVLAELAVEKPEPGLACPTVGAETNFSGVEEWLADRKRMGDKLSRVETQIARQEILGDFDPGEVAGLAERGIELKLWTAEQKAFDEKAADLAAVIHELAHEDRDVVFATIAEGTTIDIDWAAPLDIPERRLSALERERAELVRVLEGVERRIQCASFQLKRFRAEHERLSHEHDFRVALASAFHDAEVSAFGGWLPADEVEKLRAALAHFWAPVVIDARDPLPEETPPIKTTNPWIARIFEPLMHLLGRPNYRGLDPALFFAPFMMMFFGICLGDAGYGILMVAAGFAMRRLSKKLMPALKLVGTMSILFGGATFAWGMLTGSIFGITFEHRHWILIDVSFGMGNPMLLFKIALAFGILHLSIAFLLAILSAHTWTERLSKVGVLVVMWGGVLAVLKVPHWPWLLGTGLALVLFFSSDARNPLKRVGLGLWSIYGLTGLLGDVMSYARLFGLGVASAAIASVVNMLAGEVRGAVPIAVFGVALSIVVLVVGHAFNIAIGIIGALVHSARLHAVEAFPKFVHLTGAPYAPLKK